MDEPNFVNLCAEKQELVLQHLRSCIANSNFVAPLFLSELVLLRLKDGASKEELVEESQVHESKPLTLDLKIKKFGAVTFHGNDIPRTGYAVAVHDYLADSNRFLSFQTGDLFNILYTSERLNGWEIALNTDNTEVPGTYLKSISEEEAKELYSRRSADENLTSPSPDVEYLGTDLDFLSTRADSDADFSDVGDIKPKKKRKESSRRRSAKQKKEKIGRENSKKRALHDLTVDESSPAQKEQHFERPKTRSSNKKQKVIQIELSEEEANPNSNAAVPVAVMKRSAVNILRALTFAKVALSYIDGTTHKQAARPLVLVFPLPQPIHEMPLGTFYGLIREHASQLASAVNVRDVDDSHFTVWNIQRKMWIKLTDMKFVTYTLIGRNGVALRVKSF